MQIRQHGQEAVLRGYKAIKECEYKRTLKGFIYQAIHELEQEA